MSIVVITGWKPGFKKITCVHYLQSYAGYGLGDAQRVTDQVLDGQAQRIPVYDDAAALALVAALVQVGATAHVAPELDDLEDSFSWIPHACAALAGFVIGGYSIAKFWRTDVDGASWLLGALLSAAMCAVLSVVMGQRFWSYLFKGFD
jgi:hypothetical protein